MTDRKRIIIGECVSEMTVDRCQFCIDKCEASINRVKLQKVLRGNLIDISPNL